MKGKLECKHYLEDVYKEGMTVLEVCDIASADTRTQQDLFAETVNEDPEFVYELCKKLFAFSRISSKVMNPESKTWDDYAATVGLTGDEFNFSMGLLW